MHEIAIYFSILITSVIMVLIIQITKNAKRNSNQRLNHMMYLKTKQNFIDKMINHLNNTKSKNDQHIQLLKKCHKSLDFVSNEISEFENQNNVGSIEKIKSIIDERFLKFENQNNVGSIEKIKSIIDERFLKFENKLARNSNDKSNNVDNKTKDQRVGLNHVTKLSHEVDMSKQDFRDKTSKVNYNDIEIKKIKSEIMETLSKLEEIGVE
jgi:hypothetical protein